MREGAKYRSPQDRFASIRCAPANDMAQSVVRPPIAQRGGPMLGHLSSDAAYLRAVLDKGAHQCLPPHHHAVVFRGAIMAHAMLHHGLSNKRRRTPSLAWPSPGSSPFTFSSSWLRMCTTLGTTPLGFGRPCLDSPLILHPGPCCLGSHLEHGPEPTAAISRPDYDCARSR
jgi:hypothetical protein